MARDLYLCPYCYIRGRYLRVLQHLADMHCDPDTEPEPVYDDEDDGACRQRHDTEAAEQGSAPPSDGKR